MAPHAPRSQMAQQLPTPATPAPPVTDEHPPVKGPNPGFISIANQYTFEQKIRRMQKENGCDPAREDSYRLQGVQLIESVREALQLPVKTFDTACTYYHKFRLCFRDAEYNYQDASLASLFVACKVEDTIKKSREILCAAYNLKNPSQSTTQDDKMFEQPSKIIIGLERLILETIGFDFRVRYPQKTLIKVIRQLFTPDEARELIPLAYQMSLDLYKTFAPVKESTFTMALAMAELTTLITDRHVDKMRSVDLTKYHTNRGSVVETMLDLLDLYTQFTKSTKVGNKVDLSKFIDIKIKLNQEVEATTGLSRFQDLCERCEVDDERKYPITPGSATSPATTGSWPASSSLKRGKQGGEQGTMRFVFDAEEARKEQDTVAEYFKEEYEEYQIEVEEPIPESENRGHHGRDRGNHHHNNHRHHHDSGWAPYHRNRQHHDNRHKGRKGGYY